MTENENSPENLRKFLESDDPALVRMGLSMAKGSGVPEKMHGLVAGLYMWHDDKGVRTAAKSVFMKHAPDDVKKVVLETWKTSYRTIKTGVTLQRKVEAMLPAFKDTPLDTLDVWVPAFRNAGRSTGRLKAIISALSIFGGEIGKPAIEQLIKALGDDDRVFRMYTAEALGNIGDLRAVEPLIEALGDENSGVRRYAAEALGEIGDERAVEPLIRMLSDAARPHLSASAARALGKIGDIRAAESLIGVLSDGDGEARWAAAEALKMFGVQGLQSFITAGKAEHLSVSELKTILNEKELPTSGTKARLIRRLTKFEADAKKSTKKITEKNTEKLLKSENPAMIQKGLSIVKKDGVPEELLPTILGLYMWDDDKTVRAAAKSVFNKYAPAETQAKIKENWKASYRTLSITGDKFPEAVSPLLKAFKSQDDFAEIVWRRTEPLIEALLDGNKWSSSSRVLTPEGYSWVDRDHAVWALGMIGDARAIEPLVKALGDERPFISRTAAEALAKISEKYIKGKEKDNIIKFLKSGDEGLVQMGASMLKGILEE